MRWERNSVHTRVGAKDKMLEIATHSRRKEVGKHHSWSRSLLLQWSEGARMDNDGKKRYGLCFAFVLGTVLFADRWYRKGRWKPLVCVRQMRKEEGGNGKEGRLLSNGIGGGKQE